jgi:flagellar motor switch protein FliM
MSSPQLDPGEFEALMAAIDEGRRSAATPHPSASAQVVPYDLTGREWIVHRRMPVLEALDERLALRFAASLGARLSLPVRAAASPATVLRFGELQRVFSTPPALGKVHLGGERLALLALDPETARMLVTAGLGQRKFTRSTESADDLRLTAIDCAVLTKILQTFTDAMAEAWQAVAGFKPRIERFETDPRLCRIADDSEPGLLFEYQLLGALRGKLRMMMPVSIIEPFKERLTHAQQEKGTWDRRFASAMADAVRRLPTDVRAELGRTRIEMSQLMDLKVGDILPLSQPKDGPIVVYVGGKKKFLAWPRTQKGNAAIEIQEEIHVES